jgi:gliding motility-associated-like protein
VQLHASGGVAYSWLPATYLSNSFIANPIVLHPQSSLSYMVVVVDSNGCKSAKPDSINIVVTPKLTVFAGRDTSIAINQPLQLNATDINNIGFVNYSWSPVYGLDNPLIQNPVAILDKDQVYTVLATTANGCTASDNLVVKVYMGPDIFVPTAFTPNNDGLNDIFKPIPTGIKEFKFFTVFNRFGQIVYNTTNQQNGWDGIFNGMKQAPGTYVWQVKGIAYDGKVIYKKGTVVLIR